MSGHPGGRSSGHLDDFVILGNRDAVNGTPLSLANQLGGSVADAVSPLSSSSLEKTRVYSVYTRLRFVGDRSGVACDARLWCCG